MAGGRQPTSSMVSAVCPDGLPELGSRNQVGAHPGASGNSTVPAGFLHAPWSFSLDLRTEGLQRRRGGGLEVGLQTAWW